MDATGQKKARLLIAVWGSKYFDYLTEFSLPSWLAPDNLPALARLVDLEIDFLTSDADARNFSATTHFANLQAICPVNFVSIDDLIGRDMYTITLTGAFGRGMIRHGEGMTDIAFIFMNADFVLSNGSLAHVGSLILSGEEAVMAPSYRSTEEAVAPQLTEWFNSHDETLNISSRDLVRFALRAPHPTTIAKSVTQSGFVTRRPNQLYWPVDDNTVIGHHLLSFMLCIKPDRVVTHVNSYCDYSFIQHFSSLRKLHTISDSDDFFMLEMQSHDFERDLIHTGENSADYVVQMTRRWATALHYENLKQQLVFHDQELPENFESHAVRAHVFIEQVLKKLPSPHDHVGHPHWIGGLINWRLRSDIRIVPDEFDHADNHNGLTPTSASQRFLRLIRRMNRNFNDDLPRVHFWHFYWSTYRRFASEIRTESARGEMLLIRDTEVHANGIDRLAKNRVVSWTLQDLLRESDKTVETEAHFAAVILHPDRLRNGRRLIEALHRRFPSVTKIALFSPLHLAVYPQIGVPVSSVLRYVDDIFPNTTSKMKLRFSGQRLHMLAHAATIKLTLMLETRPRMAILIAAVCAPFLILLGIAGSCIETMRGDQSSDASYVSGLDMIIEFGEKASTRDKN
ncbi:MAG: hypothetical protein Q7T44_11390 [Parvibaculum sp.]|nr:hypothetical protein [Parvibaculum sp.]